MRSKRFLKRVDQDKLNQKVLVALTALNKLHLKSNVKKNAAETLPKSAGATAICIINAIYLRYNVSRNETL